MTRPPGDGTVRRVVRVSSGRPSGPGRLGPFVRPPSHCHILGAPRALNFGQSTGSTGLWHRHPRLLSGADSIQSQVVLKPSGFGVGIRVLALNCRGGTRSNPGRLTFAVLHDTGRGLDPKTAAPNLPGLLVDSVHFAIRL